MTKEVKSMTDDEQIAEKFAGLRAFFSAQDLEFKVGAKTVDEAKGKALPYLKPYVAHRRLNEVLGPANWKTELEFTSFSVRCRLSIKLVSGGEWIGRDEVSHFHGDMANPIEREFAVKQGATEAFNRAAVMFGVGEYFYSVPAQWVPLRDGKYWLSGKEPKMPIEYLPKDDKPEIPVSVSAGAPESLASSTAEIKPEAKSTVEPSLVPNSEDAGKAKSEANPAVTKEELDVIAKYVAKATKAGTRDGVRAQVDAMNQHAGLSEAAKALARDQLREVFKKAPKGSSAES